MTIIDDVGEGVTVRQVTRTLDDSGYGDMTESTSDATLNAVVELLQADDEVVKSGIFNMGDAVAYFDPDDVESIKEGNRVQHNSIWYIIKAINSYGIGGTGIHIEAYMSKIVT